MSDLAKIIAEQARQGEQIENIDATCKKIETCLGGNGRPGLVVRTDRLEQKDKTRSKLFWIIIVAVLGVVTKSVLDIFV